MDENQPHQYNLHQSDQTSPKIDAEVVEDAKHNMKCTDTSSPSTSAPLSEISLDETKTAEFKNSSSEFFHFVRLMQLFPSVHPATLHTVMTMCKSDFFVAVDRLLYAKRCKELYDTKRRMFQCAPKNNNRYAPYSCTSDICAQGLSRMRSPNVKMEPTGKKSSRKSRVEKNSSKSYGRVSNIFFVVCLYLFRFWTVSNAIATTTDS